MSTKVLRKNFSFYMPEDFNDSLDKIQANDARIQSLSKSQALYFIISDVAAKIQMNLESAGSEAAEQ